MVPASLRVCTTRWRGGTRGAPGGQHLLHERMRERRPGRTRAPISRRVCFAHHSSLSPAVVGPHIATTVLWAKGEALGPSVLASGPPNPAWLLLSKGRTCWRQGLPSTRLMSASGSAQHQTDVGVRQGLPSTRAAAPWPSNPGRLLLSEGHRDGAWS